MGKKAKGKPMRVWCVVSKLDVSTLPLHSPKPARFIAQVWNRDRMAGYPFRVVEFVAVTPRKRQKGKSK